MHFHVLALTQTCAPFFHRPHPLFYSLLVGSFKNAQFVNIVVCDNNFRISELSQACIRLFCFSVQNTNHYASHLGLDIRLITANVLLELEELGGKLDFFLEEVLSI